MLVFKAKTIVAASKNEPKPWEFDGKSGVTHSAKVAAFGEDGSAESIAIKAKTAEELEKKLARYPVGKSAEIVIGEITPLFRQGDRKASGYTYTSV
jgi:hypothetical protein